MSIIHIYLYIISGINAVGIGVYTVQVNQMSLST